MKKYLFLSLTTLLLLAMASCSRGPKYLYVDTMSDEAKVSLIDSDEDNDAYAQAFEKYSNTRFYPTFSEYEKTRRYMAENDSLDEACEIEDPGFAPADNSEGGVAINTGDDVSSLEGDEPAYEELNKFNAPNFTLYRLEDGNTQKLAQELADNKISYDEFIKKTQKSQEDGKLVKVDLFEKNFDACKSIDRSVFDKLLEKLHATYDEIDKKSKAGAN